MERNFSRAEVLSVSGSLHNVVLDQSTKFRSNLSYGKFHTQCIIPSVLFQDWKEADTPVHSFLRQCNSCFQLQCSQRNKSIKSNSAHVNFDKWDTVPTLLYVENCWSFSNLEGSCRQSFHTSPIRGYMKFSNSSRWHVWLKLSMYVWYLYHH